MKKLLIVWVIIAVLLTGTLTMVGLKIKSNNKPYLALENDLKESAQAYMGQYLNEMPSTSTNVTAKTLMENNLLKSMKIKDEECDGYVKVSKVYVTYEYKAYIKCPKYTTRGFVQ